MKISAILRHGLRSKEHGVTYLVKMRQLDDDIGVEFGSVTFIIGVGGAVQVQKIRYLLLC